jgi:hypothetical protein
MINGPIHILSSFFDWTLPVVVNVTVIYSLIYGPFVLIPVGLILVARLFLVKRRTQSQLLTALIVLIAGVLLAVIALFLNSQGKL